LDTQVQKRAEKELEKKCRAESWNGGKDLERAGNMHVVYASWRPCAPIGRKGTDKTRKGRHCI